ncbi:MAG: 5-formyltetrahydrofolate cyclo-ligase [Planctomycetes bacterium]|nr:5-formyltetrahydrofolate cyclo-ligase [Planctomycetota bacterium]
MADPNDPKQVIRDEIRQKLTAMSAEHRHRDSTIACSRLCSLEAFLHARVVMLYMPLATEVDVTPIALKCFQLGKTVCVPKVDWKRLDMIAVEVNAIDDRVMDIDEHGIRTPKQGQPIPPSMLDLIVAPGLAFDSHGRRLGRGGGFYDRFLARTRDSAVLVGIAFDGQIIDDIPSQDHDVMVDIVITERRITNAKPLRPA